jgi:hypothetical protein
MHVAIVDVFHLTRDLQSRGSPVVNEEYVHAASVMVMVDSDELADKIYAMNRAYRLTNNIDSSWSLQPAGVVDVIAPFPVHDGSEIGHRSTSTGDRMFITINGVSTWYDVAFVGFQEVIF